MRVSNFDIYDHGPFALSQHVWCGTAIIAVAVAIVAGAFFLPDPPSGVIGYLTALAGVLAVTGAFMSGDEYGPETFRKAVYSSSAWRLRGALSLRREVRRYCSVRAAIAKAKREMERESLDDATARAERELELIDLTRRTRHGH